MAEYMQPLLQDRSFTFCVYPTNRSVRNIRRRLKARGSIYLVPQSAHLYATLADCMPRLFTHARGPGGHESTPGLLVIRLTRNGRRALLTTLSGDGDTLLDQCVRILGDELLPLQPLGPRGPHVPHAVSDATA